MVSNHSRFLPLRHRSHQSKQVSKWTVNQTLTLPEFRTLWSSPKHMPSMFALALLLLGPTSNPSGLPPLRHRPPQPQPGREPPILWLTASHLSTSTIARSCLQLQKNPTALAQTFPMNKWVGDPPAGYLAKSLRFCSPKTHPLILHHSLLRQPIPRTPTDVIGSDTILISWKNRCHRPKYCPHKLEDQSRHLLSLRWSYIPKKEIQALLEDRWYSETQEHFNFIRGQTQWRYLRPPKPQWRHSTRHEDSSITRTLGHLGQKTSEKTETKVQNTHPTKETGIYNNPKSRNLNANIST